MGFSSNGTSSLCSKVEGEVMSSSPTECMCNLPIKKSMGILENTRTDFSSYQGVDILFLCGGL
jgi:hypothetical protein